MRGMPTHQPNPLNAYVSGSSRGLSFEIARQLAIGGANVALSSRTPAHLEAARSEILTAAPQSRVLTIPGDLSRTIDQDRILGTLDSEDFRPDIFVCGAGHPSLSRLGSISRPDWGEGLEMILGQAVFAAQKFAPLMAEKGYGRLIFLSSIYAKSPVSDYFMSSMLRPGLFALSKMIGEEYADRGVASFVICLGFVDSPMVRNLALGREQDAPSPEASTSASWNSRYEEWAAQIPAKRIASPSELAKLVGFLVSPEADYLNGTVFSFSGGLDRGLL